MNRCLSSDPKCSGVEPCNACYVKVRDRVITFAMVAGGFNGDATQATNFLQGYADAWLKLHEELQPLVLPPAAGQAQAGPEEPEEGPSLHEVLVAPPEEELPANDLNGVEVEHLTPSAKKRGRKKTESKA